MKAFFDQLSDLASNDSYWNRVEKRLKDASGGERRFLALGSGDFLYIPQRFFPETMPVLELLGKHKIFLEIAVISALLPVSNDFQLVNNEAHDCSLGKIRKKPIEEAYSTKFEIVHPFKMGNLNNYLVNSIDATNSQIASSCVFCNLVDISNH